MATIKKIYADAAKTTQLYPQTHEKAVVDDNGTSLESKLGSLTDLVNQKQMEIGSVPSDLTPTPNSTNWVTSGGVFTALDQLVLHESIVMSQGSIVSGVITSMSTRIYSNIVNSPCYLRVKEGYAIAAVNWFSAKDYGAANYIKNDWRTYRREINIFEDGYVAFVITNAGGSGDISPSADCIDIFQNGDQYNAVDARMLEALTDYNFFMPQLGCGRKMISRPSDTYAHAPSVNVTKKYLFVTYQSSMHKTSESFNDNRITLYVRDNEWGWTDYIDIFDDLMVDLKIGDDRITYIYNQNVINTDDNTLFVMAGAHVGSNWAWVYRVFDAPNNALTAPAIVQLSYGGNTMDFNLSNYITMLNTLYGKSYTVISSINSNELSGIAKSGNIYYSVFALLVTSSNGIAPHVLMSSPDCITWTPIAMLSDTHKNCETTITILNNKIYIGFRMASDGVFYMVTDLSGTILKDWTKVSNVSSRSCMTQAGGKVYYAYNVASGSSKHYGRNAMCIAEVNQSTYELTTIKTFYSNDGYNYFALCPTLNQNLLIVNTEDSRGYNYVSGNATTDINIAEIELLGI